MGDKITSSLHEVKIVATVPRRMTAINRVIFLRDGMFWKQLEKNILGQLMTCADPESFFRGVQLFFS